MRLTAFALGAFLSTAAGASFALADPASTPLPSASPAAAAASDHLTDAEIRTLLVGNSYVVDWREGMRVTVDVHPDGTLHGAVTDGIPTGLRMGSVASRLQDDGKYTIDKGLYCWTYMGAWANHNGKPSCAAITRTSTGYVLGSTRMTVVVGKH